MKNQIRNERDDDLIRSIVVNIAIFKGITHNKLVKKISEETSIKGKETIFHKINELIEDDLVEKRKGKGNVNYYLKGLIVSHNIHYDPEFDNEISKLLKDINEIKTRFPSLDERSTYSVFETVRHLRNNCSDLIARCKDDTDYNMADSLYGAIKEKIEKYSNPTIEEQRKEASEIHGQIKDLEKQNNEIIDKLRKAKSDPNKEKLAMSIVGNYKKCKQLSNRLSEIWHDLPDRILGIQENEFRKVLRDLDVNQNSMTKADLSIRTLREARLAISEEDKRLRQLVKDSIDSSLKTEETKKILKNKINDIFSKNSDAGKLKTLLNNVLVGDAGKLKTLIDNVLVGDAGKLKTLIDNVLVGLLRDNRKSIRKDILVTELQKTGMFPEDEVHSLIFHMYLQGEIYDSQDEIFIIRR